MNELEQRLTADLRDTATTLDVPPATDPSSLRARGDAEYRFRTRALLAGVAAAVLAAITTGIVLDRAGDPQITPAPAPTYYDDGVPYVIGGRLYIGHAEQREPGRWMSPVTVGRYTHVYNADTETTLFLRDGKELLRTKRINGPAIVSADGVAAWLEDHGDRGVLTAHDLGTGRTLTKAAIDVPRGTGEDASSGAVEITSVDADGTIHYQLLYARGDGYDRAWMVGPGAPATPRHDRKGAEVVTPDEEDVAPGFPDGVFAFLSPDHLWGAWLSDAEGNRLEEGPDGVPTTPTGLTVQAPHRPGTRFTIDIPASQGTGFISWPDLTHVEVVFPESQDLICDTLVKKCRTADRDY